MPDPDYVNGYMSEDDPDDMTPPSAFMGSGLDGSSGGEFYKPVPESVMRLGSLAEAGQANARLLKWQERMKREERREAFDDRMEHSGAVWTSNDGEILIADMTTPHIANALAYLLRKNGSEALGWRIGRALLAELNTRATSMTAAEIRETEPPGSNTHQWREPDPQEDRNI